MQKVQKMFCPNCGSPIKFFDDKDYTFCSYCGYQIYKEDEQLDRKLTHEEKKMEYVDKEEERKHKLAMEQEKSLTLITIGMIVMVICMWLLITLSDIF